MIRLIKPRSSRVAAAGCRTGRSSDSSSCAGPARSAGRPSGRPCTRGTRRRARRGSSCRTPIRLWASAESAFSPIACLEEDLGLVEPAVVQGPLGLRSGWRRTARRPSRAPGARRPAAGSGSGRRAARAPRRRPCAASSGLSGLERKSMAPSFIACDGVGDAAVRRDDDDRDVVARLAEALAAPPCRPCRASGGRAGPDRPASFSSQHQGRPPRPRPSEIA